MDCVFGLSVRRRVREERRLDRLERRRSEEAFGFGERSVESEEERGREIEQRQTEEFRLREQRTCFGRYFPHEKL